MPIGAFWQHQFTILQPKWWHAIYSMDTDGR